MTGEMARYYGPEAPDEGLVKPLPGVDKRYRLPFHAERKLERYAEEQGVEIIEIYSELPFCDNPREETAPHDSCTQHFKKQGYRMVGDHIFTKLDS